MLQKYILPFLIFFPLLFIQITLIPFISYDLVAPNLIIVVLVFYTLKYGQIYGAIFGAVFGILFDLISGGLIGSAMLSKTFAGFTAGYFFNENKIDINLGSFYLMIVIAISGTVDSVLFSIIHSTDFFKDVFTMIFMQGIFPGIYTAVIAIPIVIFYPKTNY